MAHTLFPIYTIGFGSWTLEQVDAALEDTGGVLVDIRLNPVTTRAGFNKYELTKRFGDRYEWVQAFGIVSMRAGQMKLKEPGIGTDIVYQIIRNRPAILFCSCAKFDECHRTAVG